MYTSCLGKHYWLNDTKVLTLRMEIPNIDKDEDWIDKRVILLGVFVAQVVGPHILARDVEQRRTSMPP